MCIFFLIFFLIQRTPPVPYTQPLPPPPPAVARGGGERPPHPGGIRGRGEEGLCPREGRRGFRQGRGGRSEEHTSELQSRHYLVCRLLLDIIYYIKNMTPHLCINDELLALTFF